MIDRAATPGASSHDRRVFWLVGGIIVVLWFTRHTGGIMEWAARPALLALPLVAVRLTGERVGSLGLNRRNIALALPVGTALIALDLGIAYAAVGHVAVAANWPVQLLLGPLNATFIALSKELPLRGYLQPRLTSRRWLNNVVQATIFGLGHLRYASADWWVMLASVFVGGWVLGWLRERTGSIWAPTLVHAASNVLVVTLFFTPPIVG